MDAQTLGALANIVNEAIAKAVGPLQEQIKELEGRKAYDDSAVKGDIDRLREGLGPSDVAGSVHERLEHLRKSIPDPYDDAGLISRVAKQLEDLRAEIPAAYDDTEMKSAFSEQGKRVDAVLDGVLAIKERVEEIAKSVPAAYDDTGLREEIKRVEIESGLTISELAQDVKQLEFRPEPAKPIDGRDALHLEVLPAIDEQKSYQRGTYAKHAGGLWRSFEQTSGLRGWECIVNGVKSVDAVWHGKTLTHSIELSDGTVKAAVEMFPLMTYKHVFVPGDGYLAGDTVTWAGSLWHCNVTATKAKPGDGSTDWTLAVKKGRDGKEVVSVAKGAPQPVQIATPSLMQTINEMGR